MEWFAQLFRDPANTLLLPLLLAVVGGIAANRVDRWLGPATTRTSARLRERVELALHLRERYELAARRWEQRIEELASNFNRLILAQSVLTFRAVLLAMMLPLGPLWAVTYSRADITGTSLGVATIGLFLIFLFTGVHTGRLVSEIETLAVARRRYLERDAKREVVRVDENP